MGLNKHLLLKLNQLSLAFAEKKNQTSKESFLEDLISGHTVVQLCSAF